MILDVARHKFHEGIISLIVIAIATVIVGVARPIAFDASAVAMTSWQASLYAFEQSHSVVAALLGIMLIVHASLRLSRATILSKIYPTSSMAAMSLTAVMAMAMATGGNMLSTLLVAVLTAEFIGRMLYSMRHNARLHHIFTAMMALGLMPLVDSSTLVIVVLYPLMLMSLRSRVREVVVATIGLMLPLFAFCYVAWCSGANFNDEITMLYERMMLPGAIAVEEYVTLPRLCFVAIALFLLLCVMVIYRNERLSMTLAARNSWTMMQLCAVTLVVLFSFIPSLSPASFVVVMLFVAAMLPLFFQKINPTISVAAYILLVVSAIIAA